MIRIIIFSITMNVVLLLVVFGILHSRECYQIRKLKGCLEAEKLLNNTQKSYYETMLLREENTRRFRHDIANHLICLRELIRQDEKEAICYIEELQKDMIKIQHNTYSVGNIVIDAILNYYTQMLRDDVQITVVANYIEEAFMDEVQLCTMFSNLMKNAVEELERQQEGNKYLKVIVQKGIHGLKIEVENSTNRKKECVKESFLETVKADKKNHGIGLRNVKDVVESNAGIFNVEQLEVCFRVMIILPLKVKSE